MTSQEASSFTSGDECPAIQTETLFSSSLSATVTSEEKGLPRGGDRYHELDAVRGVAALVVLSQHFADILPAAGGGILAKLHQHPWSGSYIVSLIKITPFGVIFRGSSAVATFFLLSGFVLSLPLLSAKGVVSWPRFVIKRIARLYLPFLAGFLLSVLCDALFSRHGINGLSDWFNHSWDAPLNFTDVLSHAFLINHIDYSHYNVAYWTLSSEMRVSLIFPGLFLISTRLKGHWLLLVSLILLILGSSSSAIMRFLSVVGMFLLGISLARSRIYLIERCASFSMRRKAFLGIAVLFGYNYAPSLSRSSTQNALTTVLLAATTAAALVMAVSDCRWRSFLNSGPCQFLGRISYSLYLIHLTVLYVLLYVTYGQLSTRLGILYWPCLILLYVISSISVAWLFFVVVEQPCTSLSQKIRWRKMTS